MEAGFNSMPTMPGATPAADILGLDAGQGLTMEPFDQDLNFEEPLLDGVNGTLPPLPFTPSYDFETFSTTFEDPFSYPATGTGRFEAATQDTEPFNEESSPQELDNKLLGFSAPIVKASIVDEAGSFADVAMTAELYGMFFVAEDVFGAPAEGASAAGRPLELTCYRRNLWQCSGQITLPRHVSHLVDEQGRRMPVADLVASITAVESIEGKQTEIISIPWKSGNSTVGEEHKVAAAPPTLPLDLSSGQEVPDGNNMLGGAVGGAGGNESSARVSVPVAWKRLQFKHATANNGRRKGLQQHYAVQINLLARTVGGNGELVKVAEIQSGPVIVRGRSPRNFDSRKDVALSAAGGSGSAEKKPERRGTAPDSTGWSQPLKTESAEFGSSVPRYQALGTTMQQSNDWTNPQPFSPANQHPTKKLALSPSMARPPVPPWDGTALPTQQPKAGSNKHPLTPSKGSSSSQPRQPGAPPTLPINLSLSEDERSPNRSASDPLHSPQFAKGTGGQNLSGSPLETADMLYEYFPLSLDDWMPPVDAIYRPHVVHHTVVPPDVKAQQVRSKTKRYFAAD